MKYALYCRVSTQDQTTDNQKNILIEKAVKEDWDFELFEEVESTRKTRPIKYNMLQRLRAKEFDAVVVLKLDRWGRSLKELTDEILELDNKGIIFISIRDNIDLSTATGKMQFQMICVFAEFERELIRERTLDGLARARAQGKTLGRPKGSKDKKKRGKSGYYVRHMNTKVKIENRKAQAKYKERNKDSSTKKP